MSGDVPCANGSAEDGGNQELARLLGLSRAFAASKALNLSAKLDVYGLLANHPNGLTWVEVAAALGLQQGHGFRGVVDFLDLLVSLQTLKRTGGRYSNHPTAARFLVAGSDDFCGGLLVLNNDRSYLSLEHLEAALRTGSAPVDPRIPPIHEVFGSSASEGSGGVAEHFSSGMMGASVGNFRRLAASFDFSRFTSLGDIGGSNGCLCATVCAAHAHMRAVTYDLPPVHATAAAYVRARGVEARVQVADHDFCSDAPFPLGHDMIAMGMVLHDWGLARKEELIRKAYAALPPGGCFMVIENLVDDERRTSPAQLAMSLTMLVEFSTENAYDFSFAEFCGMAEVAGFRRCELLPLVGTTSAAAAYK
ncbi:hypothetical protein FOA52_001479 [Chlamydomonas sp. UWO 241]|nr:hypothetical protein FOA52_001479 [Chlamydomonas sp. UWO 241]